MCPSAAAAELADWQLRSRRKWQATMAIAAGFAAQACLGIIKSANSSRGCLNAPAWDADALAPTGPCTHASQPASTPSTPQSCHAAIHNASGPCCACMEVHIVWSTHYGVSRCRGLGGRGSLPEADSRQKMRRSLPNTCREDTVQMTASVSMAITQFPRACSSSQDVPCTEPVHAQPAFSNSLRHTL